MRHHRRARYRRDDQNDRKMATGERASKVGRVEKERGGRGGSKASIARAGAKP